MVQTWFVRTNQIFLMIFAGVPQLPPTYSNPWLIVLLVIARHQNVLKTNQDGISYKIRSLSPPSFVPYALALLGVSNTPVDTLPIAKVNVDSGALYTM
jgi:hypothetical protein